jgi:hypothetical protein
LERSAKRTPIKPESGPGLPPHLTPGGPVYLNLLWEEELESIKPYLATLIAGLDQVLQDSQIQYSAHFGDKRSLSSPVFFEIYRKALTQALRALLNEGIANYAHSVWRFGEELADRGVSFRELVAIQHFINQSALPILMHEPNAFSIASLTAFEKLNQVRTIVVAEAYFRGKFANFNTRLQELEREAARLDTAARIRFLQQQHSSGLRRERHR